MKKNELQKILKPLIKECIKEVIFEDGVLSGIISEVVQGMGQQRIVETIETKQPEPDFSRSQRVELQESARQAMEEKKRKLEESLGGGFKGIFENVTPISSGASPGSESKTSSPLSNYASDDAGVDISGLMAIGGGKNWKNMI
jgi:hypothetical protein|tara:strand:- start:906 stop:1334 length:429 start_codon:yes stop_codon:yes gene_type:complete